MNWSIGGSTTTGEEWKMSPSMRARLTVPDGSEVGRRAAGPVPGRPGDGIPLAVRAVPEGGVDLAVGRGHGAELHTGVPDRNGGRVVLLLVEGALVVLGDDVAVLVDQEHAVQVSVLVQIDAGDELVVEVEAEQVPVPDRVSRRARDEPGHERGGAGAHLERLDGGGGEGGGARDDVDHRAGHLVLQVLRIVRTHGRR